MNSSLEQLVKNLPDNQKTYSMKYLQESFGDKLNEQELKNIVKKGIFPYSYFDSVEKLSQTEFPPIEVFTNDLTDEKMNQ